MKTAIYIEDGVTQLVITPETKFEKKALRDYFEGEPLEAKVMVGSFYDCRGGWISQTDVVGTAGSIPDKSIILTIRKDKEDA